MLDEGRGPSYCYTIAPPQQVALSAAVARLRAEGCLGVDALAAAIGELPRDLDAPRTFMCGDLGEPCRWCGDVSDALCDWPLDGGLTCSAPICRSCAAHVDGDDVDFCPAHAHGVAFHAAGGDVRHVARWRPAPPAMPIALVMLVGAVLLLGMLSVAARVTCPTCGRKGLRTYRNGHVVRHRCRARAAVAPPDDLHRWRVVAMCIPGRHRTVHAAFISLVYSHWMSQLDARRIAKKRGLRVEEWTPPPGDPLP